ncbi:MAG: diguanylate cyclase [Betaproteobacteria bacterium]|nr:diguanylate cyclase [Betaproteobacteria bacterium]MCL2886835.1 diguanylate cyclase [Betaproteobacteria bacterium]
MERSDKLKSQKILVVDGSRTVRALLVRCVRKSHSVGEAQDGAAAWHSLVLDASIVAVISGLNIASADGAGLLERIRASRLPRINTLPFYQLASDNLDASEHEHARQLGVTAFIPKKDPAAMLSELLAPPPADIDTDVGRYSTIGLDDLKVRMEHVAGLETAAGGDEIEQPPGERELKHCLEQYLNKEAGSPTASVLIFGIDGYGALCQHFGRRIGEKVVDKLSGLLRSKTNAKESLMLLGDGRIGIASNHIDREQCTTFARRICKALAAATLSVGREQIKVTVSAGIAATQEDGVSISAEELFHLASSRLDAAATAGGNRVVNASDGGQSLRREEFIARLASLLTASPTVGEMPCKNWVNSICAVCRDARPKGQPTPCEIEVSRKPARKVAGAR